MLGELLINARKLLADIERHGSADQLAEDRERQCDVDRHHDLERVEMPANPEERVVGHGPIFNRSRIAAEARPAGVVLERCHSDLARQCRAGQALQWNKQPFASRAIFD
jgi:hypothetical protein